jgi:hypothetical protein
MDIPTGQNVERFVPLGQICQSLELLLYIRCKIPWTVGNGSDGHPQPVEKFHARHMGRERRSAPPKLGVSSHVHTFDGFPYAGDISWDVTGSGSGT